MKILYVGDVYGKKGLEALDMFLAEVKRDTNYHILIINGENVADGLGIREKEYKTLMQHGAHVITLGNHSFSKNELFDFIDDAKIVRPLNYPKNTPGKGILTINYNGKKLAVIQVMGRVFMHDPLNNPFEALDDILENIDADYIFLDVHAEATSEKLAIAHYVDGRVTAVCGTHTHVQTNDAMRLPNGTFYITDVGMTGVKYGILGADKDLVLKKFTSGMPIRIQPSNDTVLQFNAVLIDLLNQTIKPISKSN
ncbi:MAG: TIGR00282 family metallophosphoesterase [Candidatus Izemoplasmataceae bacterium]|jgi:2',3'-cyclic-nucleotide 2'-phosphodiesterase|uniref:TIGR00282 family metallophosphoesterase n=1 Tax=Liberiplasma polymorphum TaxID=3374570 RepID=UPI003775C8C7